MGKINFIHRFIMEFADIFKSINQLLKSDQTFDWDLSAEKDFRQIKHLIATAPTLVIPNFDKDFIIYANVTEQAISSIIM